MTKQAMHWILLSGSVLDTLLLLRVLGLRLQRIYVFIALDCVLSVLFDWTAVYLGVESAEATRVFVYSRFLYVVLIPLVVWDAFEEVKLEVAKIRRIEAIRMVMSLTIIGLFSYWMVDSAVSSESADSTTGLSGAFGFILWAGACLSGSIFIWKTRRWLRKEGTALPRNTSVWSIYYLLTLASSVVNLGIGLSGVKGYEDVINAVLNVWLIGCTLFCLLSLRGAPVRVESEGRE